MRLEVMGGSGFDPESPPAFAIWIENRSGYHIKSLHHTDTPDPKIHLPYWNHKRREFLKYKKRHEEMTEAERQAELDAMTSATENDSFDPADYIVPEDPERQMPFRVLMEINQPDDGNAHHDDQPSLVFSVEVDNQDPKTFQLLDLVGYPKSEEKGGDVCWELHYIDETIDGAFDLVDSALLQIEREQASE